MEKSSKKEAFRKLAERRTQRALNSMSLITNLANRSNYEYEEGDVQKIITALKEGIKSIENSFEKPLSKKRNFKL